MDAEDPHQSKLIKLISAEGQYFIIIYFNDNDNDILGHEFYVEKRCAMISGTIKVILLRYIFIYIMLIIIRQCYQVNLLRLVVKFAFLKYLVLLPLSISTITLISLVLSLLLLV